MTQHNLKVRFLDLVNFSTFKLEILVSEDE